MLRNNIHKSYLIPKMWTIVVIRKRKVTVCIKFIVMNYFLRNIFELCCVLPHIEPFNDFYTLKFLIVENCVMCGKQATANHDCVQLVESVDDLEMFTHECEDCGKIYSSLKKLNGHKFAHSRSGSIILRRFMYINLILSMKLVVLFHVSEKTHRVKGGKAFPCMSCARVFEQSYRLKVHTRIHTGMFSKVE